VSTVRKAELSRKRYRMEIPTAEEGKESLH